MGGSVGVAVWGLGRHARRRVLPALDRSEETRLIGFFTRTGAVAAEAAERYRCRRWDDTESMLTDPEVDVVYVCTPTGLHRDHGAQVLRAGKHVWCEKPLTASLSDTRELVELSRDGDLALCETLMYLDHPHFDALRDACREPGLGEVLTIDSRFGIPHQDPEGFRYSPDLGGGALLDVGCYPISLAHALMPGVPDVAYAGLDTTPEFQVDVAGSAVLTSPDGTRAFLDWGYGRAYRNEVHVWGSHGSLDSDRIYSKPDDYEPVVVIRDAYGAIVEERRVPARSSFGPMLARFRTALADAALRETLRSAALDRARTLDRIRDVAAAGHPRSEP